MSDRGRGRRDRENGQLRSDRYFPSDLHEPECSDDRPWRRRPGLPRTASLQDRWHHVSPARLLGADRSRTPVDMRRERQRHAAAVARPARRRDRGTVIDVEQLPHEQVRFAHNSERQFAKLLDFYGIAWEYEPRTFTLEWDRQDRPAQAFTPDFFLPAYDLFIEIT